MKKLIAAFLLVSSCYAQTIDSAWIAAHYQKREVMIPMRDGVKLFTAIYEPKARGKYPLLIIRTPYSVAPYGEQNISPRLYNTYFKQYLSSNYIMVFQDVRGKFMSEGEFEDVRPFNPAKKGKEIDEASDTYDALEWLVKNTPNNGKAGVFGISYPGFYATMAALCRHPALKAVSPQAPVTDWFMGDDFHHNGAFALTDAFRFYSSFGIKRRQPGTNWQKGIQIPEKDLYDFHLRVGSIANHSLLLGDSITFWNDVMAHPNYDDWWKKRDARRNCKNVKPAMMIVGGSFDAEDCFGAWNLYKAIEKQSPSTSNRIVVGPWFHGGWGRSDGSYFGAVRFGRKTSEDYQLWEKAFFDYHLLGTGADTLPEAKIFFTGENRWHSFNQWPPENALQRELYLQPEGKLDFQKPAGGTSKYVSDPKNPVPFSDIIPLKRNREYMIDDQRFASRRPDVLIFTTEPLEESITLAGPVTADLFVTISTTDADFVVKVIDVFPEDFNQDSICCEPQVTRRESGGMQMLVRGEIMRGKYRNSFENPEPFIPGKSERVKFILPDVAHTFEKGHRMMIQIQSSWYPLFDMNPQTFTNIYTCSDKDFVPSEITIHHDEAKASKIQITVLKK